ncbi:hypothetical protein Raf01_60950 [Rugosimonospora africana]|uniref:Uncharacterized protein n=1 Tax=Rugosimonospora africana TaxID=556532 RepID=A0A8J3VTU7_9ACTN|nr:hypothetical protein Raf01_60950 [Rugosimonospora africana]
MIKRVTRMPSGAGVEQLFAECDADPRVLLGERSRSRGVAEASTPRVLLGERSRSRGVAEAGTRESRSAGVRRAG